MSTFGFDCKLYYWDATDPTEVTCAKDVTLNLSKSEVDLSTRAHAGWKMSGGALKEISVDFDLINPDADTLSFFIGAWDDRTPVDLGIYDGDIDTPGSQGVEATFEILSCNRDEKLSDAVSYKVSAKPVQGTPVWNTVT